MLALSLTNVMASAGGCQNSKMYCILQYYPSSSSNAPGLNTIFLVASSITSERPNFKLHVDLSVEWLLDFKVTSVVINARQTLIDM